MTMKRNEGKVKCKDCGNWPRKGKNWGVARGWCEVTGVMLMRWPDMRRNCEHFKQAEEDNGTTNQPGETTP